MSIPGPNCSSGVSLRADYAAYEGGDVISERWFGALVT